MIIKTRPDTRGRVLFMETSDKQDRLIMLFISIIYIHHIMFLRIWLNYVILFTKVVILIYDLIASTFDLILIHVIFLILWWDFLLLSSVVTWNPTGKELLFFFFFCSGLLDLNTKDRTDVRDSRDLMIIMWKHKSCSCVSHVGCRSWGNKITVITEKLLYCRFILALLFMEVWTNLFVHQNKMSYI